MSLYQTLIPWFRLVRLPNLLTVPGDPVAGFLLVAMFSPSPIRTLPMLAAAGASLCLYMFGLILNDSVDIECDRLERPDRPLPSGAITVPQARMAAIAMGLSGLNLALVAGRQALYAAAVLSVLIILYNAALKRIPVVGVVAMGLCRGASLMLGAVAARLDVSSLDMTAAPALVAAGGLTVYVAAFSLLAAREMEEEKPQGAIRWLPFAGLLIALPAVLVVSATLRKPPQIIPFVYIFFMVMTLMRSWLLGGMMYWHQSMPETIGGHIRNLLMMQACFCAAAGFAGLLPALFFLALSLVFPRLAARFYSS